MPTTHIVRNTLAAAAVVVGLIATATPARAGWGLRVGFGAAIVAPPLVVSVGGGAPVGPLYAPYAAGCYANRYAAPAYPPVYAPTYSPYPAPYYAPYPTAAPVVIAPRASFVRVWVPGFRPHWEMRRVGRFERRHR